MTKEEQATLIMKMETVYELYSQCDDLLVQRFMDTTSEKLLDEKIEVLTALVNGVMPADIPQFYDVLELMPKTGIWD